MKYALFLLCNLVCLVFAEDLIILAPGQSETDTRQTYSRTLLRAALDVTNEEYGPYKIEISPHVMNRDRALIELQKGKLITVHETATKPEWETKLLPIYIPTRKGLMGYRIYLIHRKDSLTFANITTLSQIKELRAGLRERWSITRVMDSLGFRIIKSPTYEGLFPMLNYNRFDYFSRGINEIFPEYKLHKEKNPNIILEESLATYIATPSYFFVSPKHPRIHKRLRQGLEKLIENGTFDTLFMEYHEESIKRAGLEKRKIFRVTNPLLTKETPLDSLHYWYNPGIK